MNAGPSPDDDDELIRLYHEAGDLDGRAPAQAVGAAARAHARVLNAARRGPAKSPEPARPGLNEAANAGRWRLSWVAGLALLGLAGLLVLQFHGGTPPEQPLARGPSTPPAAADATVSESAVAKSAPPVPSTRGTAPAAAGQESMPDGAARELAATRRSTPEQARAGAALGATAAGAPRPANTDTDLHRLAAAGDWPAAQRRMAAGAMVDSRDEQGRTPLMVAAQAGQAGMVRHLLRAGADARLTDHAGRTAGAWAQQSGHDDIVRLLAEASSAGAAGR